MKFKYTAIGGNNQKLEGILDAVSVDAAREQLHKMNLSIIAVVQVSDAEAVAQSTQVPVQAQSVVGQTQATPAGSAVTYFFVAKDPQQKDINGTIDASSAESAFRRLITEYQFRVLDLYPDGSPDPVTASLKPQFPEWQKMMEDEGVDFEVRGKAGTKDELEDEEGLSQEIIDEIDQFVINTKKIVANHKPQYSDPLYREIQKTLDELERNRSSNNLKHITKICNNLYELIAHPDVVAAETQGNEPGQNEYDSIVSNLKKSGFVSNQFAFLKAHSLKKKSARFGKIQETFGRILGSLSKDGGAQSKKKKHHAKWLASLSESLKGERETTVTFKTVLRKFFEWISASNIILRRARKEEMISVFHEWKAQKGKAKKTQSPSEGPQEFAPASDFSGFYMEVDSFVGWLLFFYISYFFLASFALERDIILPQELVLKTFNSPLLINISIFLLIAHLAFTLKIRFFRGQALSSIFLFFLSFGVYALLVVNF